METERKQRYLSPSIRSVEIRPDFNFLLSTNIHDWEEWDEFDGEAY